MKKRILIALVVVLALAATASLVWAGGGPGGRGAYRGEAQDLTYPELGMISYLATPAGYHFWFTPTADLGPYVAGDSYHNVYQATVDDEGEWCVTTVPDCEPYNLVGFTGRQMFYKIFDTTTDSQIQPPCP